jgi:hypothetical protein
MNYESFSESASSSGSLAAMLISILVIEPDIVSVTHQPPIKRHDRQNYNKEKTTMDRWTRIQTALLFGINLGLDVGD